MPKLDLIVTHYNEPWETGEKFYDMLCLQRGINHSDVRIIIVQDGPEGALPWEEHLAPYPYKFKIKTIPHGGVSRARNAGLEMSDAEWVMFCDFDDTFSTIHSMRKFFENMDDGSDLVFSHVCGEEGSGNAYCLEHYEDNDVFIHGKIFRREFLMQNELLFEPDVTFSEDTLFCKVVDMVLNKARKREIPEILFTHCWYEGSVCRDFEHNFSNAIGIFRSRKALCREYYKHGCFKNFQGIIIKTVFDYYYAITSGGYPNPEWFMEDFWQFWQEYRDRFISAERELVMYEHDLSFHEAVHKGFVSIPPISFWDWIDEMEKRFGDEEHPNTNTRYPRIAVYHGTRNVYAEMYTAMKSLVMHSNVEKIYLLIEDDEFPFELPECAETINVSDQQYILPDSPNYECHWTWMVMLRAAFPKIFPQHDVILSLDIDTIVTKNIDDIWDTDLTDAYYAGVRETSSSDLHRMTYTNMGVCLMNLKKLREDGMDSRILTELNTVFYPYTEQDVFNALCQGHIAILPCEYNVCNHTAYNGHEKIRHLAGYYEKDSRLIDRYKLERWPDNVRMKNKKEES